MITSFQHLKSLVYNGAEKKSIIISDIFLDRVSYELSVIEKLGFTDYFILFSRIIEVCNELNLLRSYGRGSAANSLVNYCLDITKINPIDENLIFERFILPTQKTLPDIDIDIPKGYQKQVIKMLKQKYPEYQTYFIAFSPQPETEYEDVLHNNNIYKKHPCGNIITSEKITNNTFSFNQEEFYLSTDITKDKLYENKIDILELEYLNRLQLIVNEVGEEFHPYRLPLNDSQVFEFFVLGDLDYIFQFNNPSLKRIFREFKPNSINDLSVINAMFRPGLLEHIPTVIKSKLNIEECIFLNDIRATEILKETYGLLIYQETFLNLSKEIAGISYEEADVWRRKIFRDKSKKEIISFNKLFTNGCKEHSSLNELEITFLTNMVSEMLGLTFQKAHSLSYSLVGYWGAYYKTHFRAQFDKAFSSENKFQSFELY